MAEFIYTLHWIYFIVMICGAFYLFLLSRDPKGVPKYEYVIAIFIPCWSGAAYLSIALGQGFVEQQDQVIYFARYLDWVVTTPLLLLALALTAMFFQPKKDIALISSLIGADVVMILTGLIADFSNGTILYIWYGIGVIALWIILYIIWYPLRKMAFRGSQELGKHYQRTALYLTAFWISYPTVWLLGPSALGLTQNGTEVLAFILLPIFSKVGFSILDLNGLRKLNFSS
ncbi:bacteriorhodopsin [Cytobacillus spongiae]|uniref:bacteriorhodopsin n=1 Tax=Cytobacillus spongiae TaxID=2901381 RepID=UPI001F3B1465|nr:bacteriorhodopsin [Cytobacillus spongiae]UII57580.1 bacteriorhodopsin [Cytobacillus spongiae]